MPRHFDFQDILRKFGKLVFSQNAIPKLELEDRCSAGWDPIDGRSQSVQVDKLQSHPLTLKVGVPQGLLLGPLLAIMYLNSIIATMYLKRLVIVPGIFNRQ